MTATESGKLVKVKSTRHAKYQIAYHFVWIPKYRKSILKGEIKEFLEELFKEIAQEYGFEILAMEVMPDHIHLFVSAPPKYSPSTIVKIFKGISAKNYFKNFLNFAKNIGKTIYGPLPTT